MQRLNLDIKRLQSMEFNFNYEGNDGLNDGFKIFLMNSQALLFIIIKPMGKINPRSKSKEIYLNLTNLLFQLGLENKNKKIWLDLMNIYGINHPYIFEWKFENIDEKLIEQIKVLDYSTLDEVQNDAINYYYKNQLSTFSNSRLNAKQKIEIMSYELSSECYDEFVQENWIRYFRIFINKFKRRKSS